MSLISSTLKSIDRGTASVPSYRFTQDTDTGIYSSTTDNVDFTIGGVRRLGISNDKITMTSRPYQTLNGYASTSGYLALAPKANRLVAGNTATSAVSTWFIKNIQSSFVFFDWQSVCWAPELGIFCAVSLGGSFNTVMTSSDGSVWTTHSVLSTNFWSSVCWAPELGLFCAVSITGSSNRVMTSPDGVTWTTRSTPNSNNYHDICWAPEIGLFCAVAYSGTDNRVMTSPNGTNWTSRSTPANNLWYGVCWAPEIGLFCAVGASGSGNRVMTSPDGAVWTTRLSPADYNWRSVCWSSELGLFCAVAQSSQIDNIMTSPDGIIWTTQVSNGNQHTAVRWAPELGLFCTVSESGTGNRVMTSPNGTNWTSRSTPVDKSWYGLCWSGELGIFVSTAINPSGDPDDGNQVMTSRSIVQLSAITNVDTGSTQQLSISDTAITSTVPQLNPVGSATAPTYSFTGDTNTGIYSSAADNVDITTGGVQRLGISNTNITPSVPILSSHSGTVAAPNYSFTSSSNTGIAYTSSSPHTLDIIVDGNSIMTITKTEITPSVPITGTSSSVSAGTYTVSNVTTTPTSLTANSNTFVVCNSSSNITLTLPDITGLVGRFFYILNSNITGNVILNTFSGSQFIDASPVISVTLRPLDRIQVLSWSTTWFTF